MKRQLGLAGHHLRGLANATAHVCLVLMCVLAVAIASYRTGRRGRARSVRYWTA